MLSNLINSRKRWKPPSLIAQASLIAIFFIFSIGIINGQKSQEELEDPVDIIIDYGPYSLKFSLNDTENFKLENVTCKSAGGVEHTANEDFICENLDPCTSYIAIFTIKRLQTENQQSFYKTIDDVKTEYQTPEITSFNVESDTEKISLKWTVTDLTCVSNYSISVTTPEKVYERQRYNYQTEEVFENLNPCQEHFVQLLMYDVNEKLVDNMTTTSTTEYIEPGSITGIFINTTYEPGHAKITWEPPQYKSCIEYYYLEWYAMDCEHRNAIDSSESSSSVPETENPNVDGCISSTKLSDSNAKEFIINGLQGCENYGLQFFINNEKNPKSDVEEFTAPELIPGIVEARPAIVSATTVTLHWTIPQINEKCVKHYIVVVIGPLQLDVEQQIVKDTATDENYATFDGLEPCGDYIYSVQPVSLDGTKADIMNSNFGTLETTPTAVRNILITPEPYAININWQKPAFAHFCVKEYRLSIWLNGKNPGESRDVTTPDTNATVNSLISCQSYTVQIIPTTISSEDGELIQVETETAETVAQPPENFQLVSRYSDGLELSTRNGDGANNCETIFARFYCEPNQDNDPVPIRLTAERNVEGRVAGTSFKALLSPLSPHTKYNCYAKLYNVAGWSQERQILVETRSYYAETPEDISVQKSSSSSVMFVWNPPLYPNGNIIAYIAQFQRVRAEYFVAPKCPLIPADPLNRETLGRELSFASLQPYTRYSIQIAAKNDFGIGDYTRPFMVVTKPSMSEVITNLKLEPQGPYESDTLYQANVLVSWNIPCKSNGQIMSFELEFQGERGEDNYRFQRSVPPEFDEHGAMVYNETNLKPEYNYTVTVAVRVDGVEETSAKVLKEFDAPAGIPKRFNETVLKRARVDAFESNNPANSAVVRFPANVLDSEAGTIIYAALLLSEKECNSIPTLTYGAIDARNNWPDSQTWYDVYKSEEAEECIGLYQTTSAHWKPTPNSATDEVEFTVGTEKCDNAQDYFCNGALKPDTAYYLVIRLFTKSGYNDAVVLDFYTDSLVELKLILITVLSCLLLALLAGFIYIYITKRMQWKRQSLHDIEDPFGDIMTKNFATYYTDISKPEKIAREFKELTMVAMDFSYSASELGYSKNRYTDIYPYDKNRVILDIDAEGSDYINASFIDGYRRKKEYIATQGPKPESTLDFWRMILQHNIRVIVMVTQFREGDAVKCHEYFPYKSKGINVTVKKKETFDLYDRSEMSVAHDRYGLKQKVVHFYFKKWPDHGCPVDPMHLISFVRKVKAEKVPSYSSIVVHCSAGVGRTGTFIGLDIIMQRIKSESKINVYGTVKKLRFQRMKMVQTQDQYAFLYKCAYELVKHKNQRNKSTKKVSFPDDPEALATTANITSATNKTFGRLVSDLTSIEEAEHENSEVVSNGDALRERPQFRMTLNNASQQRPIKANGYHKEINLEGIEDAENVNDKRNTNESLM